MKVQLIMVPNQPILVSDKEIKVGDYFLDKSSNRYFQRQSTENEVIPGKIASVLYTHDLQYCEQIIAGLSELPQIDFSALSEEDCKKIGWVDVQKLGHDRAIERRWYPNSMETRRVANEIIEAVKYGFKTAQSLNENKSLLSEIINIINEEKYGQGSVNRDEYQNRILNKIQSLFQPKVFDVELEMEDYNFKVKDVRNTLPTTPKITNNSIKIIKVL